MSKITDSRSRSRRLFEVRFPFIYLGLSALWLTMSIVRLLDPTKAGDAGELVFSISTGVLALGLAAAAVANLVMRGRGAWPSGSAPLAQESDPSLRQTS
jgi:fatty acid desaturase